MKAYFDNGKIRLEINGVEHAISGSDCDKLVNNLLTARHLEMRASGKTALMEEVQERGTWNRCLEHSILAVKSVRQDWAENGAELKMYAADYILSVLETGKKRSTDII